MIELANIKTTDTLGQLRGQINTMQNEIVADQPFIGYVMNPSISFYRDNSLVGGVTASELAAERLFALCFPESNGVFVASLFGQLRFVAKSDFSFNQIRIDIPGIKLATRDSVIGTFVNPNHLGMSASNTIVIGNAYCGDARLIAALEQHDNIGELRLTQITGVSNVTEDTPIAIVL